MSDELERRLRRDLSTLDDVPIGGPGRVQSASRAAISRRARQRRRIVAGLSTTLVASAGIGVWAVRSGTDGLVTIDTTIVDTGDDSGPSITNAGIATDPSTNVHPTTTVDTSSATGMMRPIAVDPRGAALYPSVVWTGEFAIVVGGRDLGGDPVRGAATYSPSTDTWESIADPGFDDASAGRTNMLTVWTGTEMLVLGGDLPDGSIAAFDAQAYDPSTDSWRVTASPPGLVDDRSPWVWTGTELLVWPSGKRGQTGGAAPVGYDPRDDTWRELPEPPVRPRREAASVWTGTDWVVWGGTDDDVELDDGAAYDPSTDAWRVIAGSPLSKRRVRGVWTGSELIVAAGSSGGDRVTGNGAFAHGDGAAYDPERDTWRSIGDGPAHPGFEPLWTGQQLLMFAKGGVFIYEPSAGRWIDDCCDTPRVLGAGVAGAPVWTGTQALQIGSSDPSIGGVTYTPGRPLSNDTEELEPIDDRADCGWVLDPTLGAGAGGHQGTFFALRNRGAASCDAPALQVVTGHTHNGLTLTADLGQTYLPLSSAPADVEPGEAVTIVVESSNAGPCGARAEVDVLTIVLSDSTTFEVPLPDPLEVSCEFAADLGVQ
jgi:hypothetical protein